MCSQEDSGITIPVSDPYTEVCGQVQGYSVGDLGAFFFVFFGGPPATTLAEYISVLRGVVISRANEHVWTFAAGNQAANQFATSTPTPFECPCLLGADAFFGDLGVNLPAFVGDDYFCESEPTPNYIADAETTSNDFVLWDGLNCDSPTECCNDGIPPFFNKVLSSTTSDPISISTTVGVSVVNIYVR